MHPEPDERTQLASIARLRELGPELSAALLSGPDELRPRILSRLVKEVTFLKDDRNIEVTLVLPRPDVPSGSRQGTTWPRPKDSASAS
jgi:hypothetical protein